MWSHIVLVKVTLLHMNSLPLRKPDDGHTDVGMATNGWAYDLADHTMLLLGGHCQSEKFFISNWDVFLFL